ncbi:uncharacterized protein UTRI_03992_B [Ustilago trichophora]|uniref:FAD dependent oxidoreductase domain-containing protein n=1 Tax=Ustilago trichophora TaxID=86804 RepID=A0A5C3E8A5_9BASI|nr:uncharacterized protein UTRI_03992_B [Ustilago trichophora]
MTAAEAQEYVDISTIGIDNVSEAPAPLPSASDKATVSYWMATTSSKQLPISLDEIPAQSDVVIIGSGITGVSCAYHLVNSLPNASSTEKQKLRSITIVEARSFCSGATGRNGGHLTAASALAYTDLAANPNHLLGARLSTLSNEEIKVQTGKVVQDILNFETNTANHIRSILKTENAEEQVGFTDDRNWHLCFEHAEVDAFQDSLRQAGQHQGMRRFVEQVRRVPMEEVDERMNQPLGIVAVYEIPGATLHPRKLVSLIYSCAQRSAAANQISLNLVTDTPVHQVSVSRNESILTTSRGDIKASYVVHATNGYASHLLPHLSSPSTGIIPTRAQVVAVAPSSGKHLWGMGLSAGGGYEYGHQRPSTESTPPLYILGGGREYATGREWGVADDTSLNSQVSAFLHPYLAKTFPDSYGEKVTREWTGIMGYTKSKDPLVGPVTGSRGGKEYIAAGYSGHGMTRAFGCAQVIADMMVADVNGEKWNNKSRGLPECYLTEPAKAMLLEAAEVGKKIAAVGPADGMVEKNIDAEARRQDEKLSQDSSASCCIVT